jgi:hypothetical protein
VTDGTGQKLAYVYFEDNHSLAISFSRRGELRGPSGYPTMRRARDSELIFPIKDTASAALMLIKADCLHKAGIIGEAEKQYVRSRARTFLGDVTLKDVA